MFDDIIFEIFVFTVEYWLGANMLVQSLENKDRPFTTLPQKAVQGNPLYYPI